MPTNIWNKQPKETKKAFEAFKLYRDMGFERSQAKVAKKLGKSTQLMSRWSRKYKWVKRAAAWDTWKDVKMQEATIDEIQKAARNHVRIGQELQRVGLTLLKKVASGEIGSNTADVIRCIVEGTKIERAALDLPETIIRRELTGDGGGPLQIEQVMAQFIDKPEAAQLFQAAISKLDGFEDVPEVPWREVKAIEVNGAKKNGKPQDGTGEPGPTESEPG